MMRSFKKKMKLVKLVLKTEKNIIFEYDEKKAYKYIQLITEKYKNFIYMYVESYFHVINMIHALKSVFQ